MGRITELRVTPTAKGFQLQGYRRVARGKIPMGDPVKVEETDPLLADGAIVDWYTKLNPPKL